jgi:hypothetical protein
VAGTELAGAELVADGAAAGVLVVWPPPVATLIITISTMTAATARPAILAIFLMMFSPLMGCAWVYVHPLRGRKWQDAELNRA